MIRDVLSNEFPSVLNIGFNKWQKLFIDMSRNVSLIVSQSALHFYQGHIKSLAQKNVNRSIQFCGNFHSQFLFYTHPILPDVKLKSPNYQCSEKQS